MSRDYHLCWYHGKITRENAEELVMQAENAEDGTFLIRESNTAAGDFVLTLLHEGAVCHYQIRRHGEHAFFSINDKVKILHGLDSLVEFYQQAPNGLVTKLTTLVKKDVPPNDLLSHGATNLLHRSTKENNFTVVSAIIKCGDRNLDAKNANGQTALHLAALHCDEMMLELLLNAGVSVNCMDTAGNMPLHYACRHQSASFVRTLIEANANVQGRNIKNGFVPLHEAAKSGNLDAVKELLNAHAPLLPRTNSGEFPIDLAKEECQQEVVAFLNNYKLPAATTFESQWYHGTLKREEAVEALLNYASNMEKTKSGASGAQSHAAGPAVITSSPEIYENQEVGGEKIIVDAVVATVEVSASNISSDNEKEVDTSGCFLVRFSERKTNGSGYVLTLLCDKNVKNFIISKSSNYLYIDEGPYLPSLEHLVEHFMRFSDGLPVSLKYPVLPKPKPPLPLFSTMPRATHRPSAEALLSRSPVEHEPFKSETVRKYSLDAHKNNATEKYSQTLTTKKKHKDHSNSVFPTLKLRSPKKSSLIEGMNSLRKSKTKSKAATTVKDYTLKEDELRKANALLKNLSFSTEFSSLHMTGSERGTQVPNESPAVDGFYNVPKNNTAIINESGVGEEICELPIEIESKTDEEVLYFTKSDIAIEIERQNGELDAFQNYPPKFATNANGYIPTVDIRVFLDYGAQSGGLSAEALEASSAELREFSNHPERLDSLISTASNESDIMRYLNRQNSNFSAVSTMTQGSEAGSVQSKLKSFIPRECLELDAIIGEGEFGSVYKGCLIRRNSETGLEARYDVAIKTLRDEHCRTNKQEFLREASVMIRLQHHCIVQLIGISKGDTLMMVQEIVPLGSMLHFILEHNDKINPKYELKLWASQIACGMQYLESHHFVHRDLAARNILLASRNQAKISDFGLSRALGSGNECYQASQGGKWPIKWYAPESYNNGLFSHASDVWSFGVTLWEMFSLGEAPYGEIRGVDAIQLIESGQRLPRPNLCPEHVYEIMKNCWNYKPKDRPTFRYLTDFFTKDPDYQNIVELVKTEHIS